MKKEIQNYFMSVQSQICDDIECIDSSKFLKETWVREAEKPEAGGGYTCVLENGSVFEKAGVNFSSVSGKLPVSMTKKLINSDKEEDFFATGISLVIHPFSPLIPTTHANFRYLEVAGYKWFGGGLDLTPYYINEEDIIHFHSALKETCDNYSLDFYPKFKKECDKYFYINCRKEHRGIGGIFFDYLGKEDSDQLDLYEKFTKEIASSWSNVYLPIVRNNLDKTWTDKQKEFQLIRRGRYVEFNLLYDRGTKFGLETNGRVESIFMSLPSNVKWNYNYIPNSGSEEEKTINLLKNPKAWV